MEKHFIDIDKLALKIYTDIAMWHNSVDSDNIPQKQDELKILSREIIEYTLNSLVNSLKGATGKAETINLEEKK